MKIAISEFQGRVSPVFDWSTHLIVIEMDGTRVIRRLESSIAGLPPAVRAERLAEMGVETLLCGGISRFMLSFVEARGVRVIPWVAGDVEQVLVAFIEHRIPGDEFVMPGHCRRRHGHGCASPERAGRCGRHGKGRGGAPGKRKERR